MTLLLVLTGSRVDLTQNYGFFAGALGLAFHIVTYLMKAKLIFNKFVGKSMDSSSLLTCSPAGALDPAFHIVAVERLYDPADTTARLPAAHTCFRQLDLPR